MHALTANLLRPGGAFEAVGLLDHQPAALAFPAANGPRTRVRGFPSVLLQAPASALADEALTPGDGQLRGLICVAGDPVGRLAAPGRVRQALDSLELLVALETFPTATTALADWVLPTTTLWEREDLSALVLSLLPARTLQAAEPVLPPVGESREEQAILAALFDAASPPVRGGDWGLHLRLAGRKAATADLQDWVDKLLDLAGQPSLEELRALPRGADEGELNRAEWRVERPQARIDLAPSDLREAVAALEPPEADPALPRWLVTRTRGPAHLGTRWATDPEAASAVRVHPSAGVPDGQAVVVRTRHGEARGIARHDERLREDTVEVPWSSAFEAGQLVGDEAFDPFTGTPDQVGLACEIAPG